MKTPFTILLFLFIAKFSLAQNVIPFRLTADNTIIIKALVNDKDSLDLMFQIAMKDAAISPQRHHDANHIKFNESEISDNNTVKIGALEFKNIRFFNNELSGKDSDGKIGTGIFNGKIFQIDYDKNQLVIHDKMPKLKGYFPIELIKKDDVFFIKIDNTIQEQQYQHLFYLQSGYSGGLLYDNKFSDDNLLIDKLKIVREKTLKNSAGQSVSTKQASLPKLRIGKYELENMSAGFFTGELKTQPLSIFGADLLKRFNWIFDAERKIAYIKPSRHYPSQAYEIK